MARVPQSTSLSNPRLSGGRAIRNIPGVEVPGNFQVPVADLPDRVSVPEVNLSTPDIPNAVPVASSVNIPVPDVPKTLYTASDRAALAGPGRAIADLGQTIASEGVQWGRYLQGLEMGKAKLTMVKGLTQLDSELAEDSHYETYAERYNQGAAKVKADALRHITTPSAQQSFSDDFDVDVLKTVDGIKREAKRKDEEKGREELTLLLKTNREQLADPFVTPDRRRQIVEESDAAVDSLVSLGYMSEADGKTKKAAFKSDVAQDEKAQEIYDATQSEDPEAFNRIREDLDGGKALSNLRKAGEDVQRAITGAAEVSGVSASWLAEIANANSGFNPANLYGIEGQDWESAVRTAYKRKGNSVLPEVFRRAGYDIATLTPEQFQALQSNPDIQALVFAERIVSTVATLEEKLEGDYVGLKDVYLAQTIGPEKAARLIRAMEVDPDVTAASLFPAEAKGSPESFARSDSTPKTLADMYAEITGVVGDGSPSFAYENMDASTRLTLKNKADSEEYQAKTRRTAVDQVRKAKVEQLMKADESNLEDTGVGVEGLDPGEITELLGPEKAYEHAQRREVAQTKFETTHFGRNGAGELAALESLTNDELAAHEVALTPPDGDPDRPAKKEIHEAVSKRVKEIVDLRDSDPARAVEQTPEVQSALAEAEAANAEAAEQGLSVAGPEQIGQIARARMAAQERLEIPEGMRAPITRKEAKQLMGRLAGLDTGGTKAAWTEVVNEVEMTYGKDLAKQVIASAIGYEIGDRDQAELVTNLLNKAVKGGRFTQSDLAPFYQLDELRWSDGFMNPSAAFAAAADQPQAFGQMRASSGPVPKRKPPTVALQYLRDNPNTIELFTKTYGWSKDDALKELQKVRPTR